MELATASIAAVAPRIAAREVSCVELLGAVLERIDRLDGALHAYVTLDVRGALEEARAADAELAAGRRRGPLHGIPVGVKDSIAVAGLPATNGSPAMARNVPDRDATSVARLRAAGAVILGKHALHEWAMGGTCTRIPGGPVRNPWDVGRVPGGSSGGSAAAVSAGLAFAAIGTDGWGSIRTPAAYCGVVGLKPTRGLVSRWGELPATTAWNNQMGPLARTVEDARIMLEAIAGPDPRDPTSRPAPAGPPARQPGPRGLRVGLARTPLDGDVRPAVRAAVERGAALLEGLGATIVEVPLPSIARTALALPALGTETRDVLLPLALRGDDAFGNPDVRMRVLAGELWEPADVRRAEAVAATIRAEVLAALAIVDVLLLPTNSTPAFPVGAARWEVGDGEVVVLDRAGGQGRITTRLTLPFNLVGGPALSLPAPDLVDGMPVGIQLVGRPWEDHRLLDVAALLEAEGACWRPPPALRPVLD
jgi:aspartyl-tRNA(Asn)/glutamyl-tRNA(Gln) amidotransferase subunit A